MNLFQNLKKKLILIFHFPPNFYFILTNFFFIDLLFLKFNWINCLIHFLIKQS